MNVLHCLSALSLALALPLSAQLAPDGLGWGQVRLGTDYESAKEALRKDGWSIWHKLGEGPGEATTYGKRFGAKPPVRMSSAVREYQVFSEFWQDSVWDLYVKLEGVEPASIRADLTRLLGPAENVDGANALWTTPRAKVTGFFTARGVSLHFLDLPVNERIEHQQLVDQGLEKGELSGRGPKREPTSAESACITGFHAAVQEALPPPPPGFEVAGQSEDFALGLIDKEEGAHPLKREHLVLLVDRQRAEAAAAAREEVETKAQPRLLDNRPKDTSLSVRIAINERDALVRGLKPARKVAGHATYFRMVPPNDSIEEESETVVLLGAWRPSSTGIRQMDARWDPSQPVSAVQNLQVQVCGDPTRVRAYLEAIRWDRLAALLVHSPKPAE